MTRTRAEGRNAGCLRASGVDPDKPVTGNPDSGSAEGINGWGWNAGLTHDDIGMIHAGLAHPTVTKVAVEPPDEGPPLLEFATLTAPNVEGLAVYFAYSPPGVARYRLVAYDAHGCQVDVDPVDLAGMQAEPPGEGEESSYSGGPTSTTSDSVGKRPDEYVGRATVPLTDC